MGFSKPLRCGHLGNGDTKLHICMEWASQLHEPGYGLCVHMSILGNGSGHVMGVCQYGAVVEVLNS